MKTNIFKTILVLFITLGAFGQSISTGSGNTYNNLFMTPGTPSFVQKNKENLKEFKKISHKMYLSNNYLTSKIDKMKGTVPMKYNIYKDEMEFSKNGQILFLNKHEGRKVFFTDLNKTYTIFNYNGKLRYFVVHNDGKNKLLSREIIKYVKAKPAQSSYVSSKPADFKRKDDAFYLISNNSIVKISTKKKSFYLLFGSNSAKIKKFVKSNKLNIKKTEDLKKIIMYSNTI